MLEKYFIIDKDYKNPLLLQVAEQDFCVKINKNMADIIKKQYY